MSAALRPGRIGTLELRNRIIKTATYEGMTPGGKVTDALVEHHADLARRGVALTTVAYGAVHPTGRTFSDQLLIAPGAGLERIPDAVHAHGGAACLQLAHCGGFSKNRAAGRPMGPSFAFNAYGLAYGLPFVRRMAADDIAEITAAYAEATAQSRDAGFDAVELHCGHGYLLSQFLSPTLNRRRDGYGGDLERRLRFPLEVVRAIRERVGPSYPILAKTNLNDGVRGGSNTDDAIAIARALTGAGVDAIVPSGGLVQRSAFYLMRGGVPIKAMTTAETSRLQRWAMRLFAPFLVRKFVYESSFFFDQAARVLDDVDVPVALLGGVDSASAIQRALDRGFAFVALGRALLADPDFVERLAAGEDVTSRCTHGNQCVAQMVDGVRCVLRVTPDGGLTGCE